MTYEPRVCAADGCENEFVPSRSDKIYCSKKCANHQWHAMHRKEVSERAHQYRAEHRHERLEHDRQYYKEHCDERREGARQYRLEHRHETREYNWQYSKGHREEISKQKHEYYKEHRTQCYINIHKRRALKAGSGGTYTTEELDALWHKQRGFCFYCGDVLYKTLNSKYHVEHLTPLSRGGTNDISNIALSCETCNRRKYTKTAAEFVSLAKIELDSSIEPWVKHHTGKIRLNWD